jgi:carbamoyltransferase
MYILGISCYFHDASAALIKDGVLIAAAEEERFSRIKHDYEFPEKAIEFCLAQAGITGKDLEYVVFFEKPFLKMDRLLRTALKGFPKTYGMFVQSMRTWLMDKLWIKSRIGKSVGVKQSQILFSEHHLSHAASAFFCSPFEESAVLTFDGVGEWNTTTMGVGKGNDLTITQGIQFPHSIGLLYSAFTAFLGFEVNEGEYKVMGMAPYGRPTFVDKIWKVVKLEQDGTFWMDPQYFSFHYSTSRSYTSKFVSLFGAPRDANIPFFTETSGYPSYYGPKPSNMEELYRYNQHYADLAASIQAVTEELVLGLVRELHRQTGQKQLCLAGGVALNSVANRRILQETPFEELYIQPSAGDGGGALGAAMVAWHCALGNQERFVMDHAYWGQGFEADEIQSALDRAGARYTHIPDTDKLIETTVDSLTSGEVVGWFQGRFEWGPRALGNRSIIADPRSAEMKDIVNNKIKFREPFRPFAPSVLAGKAEEYFDLASPQSNYPARFMLLVVPVLDSKQEKVPAVSHLGTARIQTVHADANPLYYGLIRKFDEATGVPLLLNTSFNVRGEPIVNTPDDALNTFGESGIDTLVLGNFVVRKP